MSADGGPFVPWLQRTTLRGAVYPGALGSRYAFYSIATDAAGNREEPPATPDAETLVSRSNAAPVLVLLGPITADEGATVVITNVTTDADEPAQTLTFSLAPGTPSGALINPATGVITWSTSELTGPSTNWFTVVVRDNGTPSQSATGRVMVVINEVNTRPTLAAVGNFNVAEGQLVTFTNRATDPDLPAQALTFTLAGGTPAGASLHAATGVFTWRPADYQGGTTNQFAVIVTDSGTPALSATQTFTVIVRDSRPDFALSFGTTNLLAGQSGSVPLFLNTGAGLTNVSLTLETDLDRLTNLVMQSLAPDVAEAELNQIASNRFDLQFRSQPGRVLQGQFELGRLAFETRGAEQSAVVPLLASAPTGWREGDLPALRGAAASGRVFIVAREPILDPILAADRTRWLALYGHAGRQYAIEATTNLCAPNSWFEVRTVRMAGMREVLGPFSAPAPAVFYRVREAAGVFLTIQDQVGGVRLTWPISGEDWVLQATTNLSTLPVIWTEIPLPYTTQGAANVFLIEPATAGNRFYRLHKP